MALVTGDEFAVLALSVVGLTAGDPAYAALIADGENDAVARDMIRESGCGLVLRGLLGRVVDAQGIARPPALTAPLLNGSIMGVLEGLAVRAGAVDAATAAPEPGDVVWLGGPEHLEVFVGDGWRVAGGERDTAGRETIRCVTRSGASLDDAPAQPAIALAPRQVLRIVRAAALLPYLEGGGS